MHEIAVELFYSRRQTAIIPVEVVIVASLYEVATEDNLDYLQNRTSRLYHIRRTYKKSKM